MQEEITTQAPMPFGPEEISFACRACTHQFDEGCGDCGYKTREIDELT